MIGRCSAVSRVPFGGFAALDTPSAPSWHLLLPSASLRVPSHFLRVGLARAVWRRPPTRTASHEGAEHRAKGALPLELVREPVRLGSGEVGRSGGTARTADIRHARRKAIRCLCSRLTTAETPDCAQRAA